MKVTPQIQRAPASVAASPRKEIRTPMGTDSTTGLSEARGFLRDLQAKQPTSPTGRSTSTHSKADSALASLHKRRHFTPTGDPKVVTRGGMKFDPVQEERRITL